MRDHKKPEPLCTCVGRKCLKCDEVFMSRGDRVCDNCQKKNRGLSVFGGKYTTRGRNLRKPLD